MCWPFSEDQYSLRTNIVDRVTIDFACVCSMKFNLKSVREGIEIQQLTKERATLRQARGQKYGIFSFRIWLERCRGGKRGGSGYRPFKAPDLL